MIGVYVIDHFSYINLPTLKFSAEVLIMSRFFICGFFLLYLLLGLG